MIKGYDDQLQTYPGPEGGWPRISVVTPSFNQGEWIRAAIESVLGQGYPNLEYLIIDGGSRDQSWDIIREYGSHLAFACHEPDGGMYAGVEKGLARATGEIIGWLNADDMLHRGALFTLARIFTDLPRISWLTGCRSVWDEAGCCVATEPARAWTRQHLLAGDYEWIQQESTYWRRSLYLEAGGNLSSSLRFAGDLELWLRMSRHADLYSTDALIGGFRARSVGQASLEQMSTYREEATQAIAAERAWQQQHDPAGLPATRQGSRISGMIGRLSDRLGRPGGATQPPPRVYFDRRQQRFRLPGVG